MSNSSDADSTRCKAIAISTGQRCTRRGKLDGYCSEKHKQQADSTNGLWGLGRQPFTDSEGESHPAPAATKKTTKTTKTPKAEQIKKSSDAKDVASSSSAPAAVPATPAPATSAKEPKSTKAKPTASPKKAPAPRKKAPAKTSPRSKKRADSSDGFEPESDDDYKPGNSDSDDSGDSDSDSEEEDDDLKEITGSLASVKIKSDDPTLPPKPSDGSTPMKTKVKRMQSKVFNTGAVLAPPKNKMNANSAGGRTSGGFWIPAPAPVKVPESTIKALASVKDKILSLDSSSSDQSDSSDKKHSGLFKYRARVHTYLFSNDDDNDQESDSKRSTVRKIFKSLLFKLKGDSESQEKPLPSLPSEAKETKETKTPSQGRKPSVASVDSITKDITNLSVKSEDSQDGAPNQCHGFNTNGHRCKRRVKLDRPIIKGEVLMCHDHEINDDEEVVVHIEGKGGVLLQWLDLSCKYQRCSCRIIHSQRG